MSYLDYHHHNDMGTDAQLRHDIVYKQNDVAKEMHHARVWKARAATETQKRAIRHHVKRARTANNELLGLLRLKAKRTEQAA